MPTRIFILLILFSSQMFPQNKEILSSKLNSLLKSETLKHAQFSVTARYVDNGESIISHNGEMSLAPASNLKVFTTSAALELLGENYSYETKLLADGEIDKEGVLNGNLIFLGGGDPTLGSNNFEDRPQLDSIINMFADAVVKEGIKIINGGLIADNSRYDNVGIPGTWNWIDIGNYYGAQTSGLAINDNLYYLFFKPGSKVGDKAEVIRTEPEITGLKFINNMKTGPKGSGDNGYIFNSPNSFVAVLRGTIPQGYNEFSIKGSVPNPALMAVQLLENALKERGIVISEIPAVISETNSDYIDSKLILNFSSLPLKEIVRIINKKSFNFYSDMVLKELGYKIKGEGSFQKGIEAVEDFFIELGIDIGGLKTYDGSGLSRANMITTAMMTELLIKMYDTKSFEAFFNSLPVAGNRNDIGSLRNFGRNTIIENRVFAKTGSIGGVRAHSGYVKTESGKLAAFSIITNNFNGSSRPVNEIHKQIMIEIAKLN